MKAGTHKFTIEAQLVLSQRELELLNHVASYDNGAAASLIADNAQSNSYLGGVKKEEVIALFHEIRAKTDNLMSEIQSAKEKLFHQ